MSPCVRTVDMVICLNTWHSPAVLGRLLIWGLYPYWFESFVNWVSLPRLGPAVDWVGVTALVLNPGLFWVSVALLGVLGAPFKGSLTP